MNRSSAVASCEQGPSRLETGPQYLYGIISAREERTPAGHGVADAELHLITNDAVAAVVSPLLHTKVRPERRHLAAHQQVLAELMEQEALLPVSFGTVAASAAGVRKFLAANRKALAAQLERVRGKVEMGVRVTWDVPNIFEYFVDRHDELRQARDRLFGAQGAPAHDEKLAIGRLFERLLEEDREAHATRVEEKLAARCSFLRRDKCRAEKEVMNLACLVGRQYLADFEEAVFAAARDFDNSFAFDYNGPWPPYHFVELDLRV